MFRGRTFILCLMLSACAVFDSEIKLHEDLLTGTKRHITEFHWIDTTEEDVRVSLDVERIAPIKGDPSYRFRVRVVSLAYKKNRIKKGVSLKIKADAEVMSFSSDDGGEELEGSGYVDVYVSTAYFSVTGEQLKKISEAKSKLVWVDAGPRPITGLFKEDEQAVFLSFVKQYVN